MLDNLETSDFPECCGINLVHGFDFDSGKHGGCECFSCEQQKDNAEQPPKPEDYAAALADRLEKIEAHFDMGHCLLATTGEGQDTTKKLLPTLGWRSLRRFRNPNSGAVVTIWIKFAGVDPPKKRQTKPRNQTKGA